MHERDGCSICEYAAEHFCWPRDHQGTHCKDCHRSWRGLAEIHCVQCHEHFSSPATLDAHQVHLKCLDPATAEREDGTLRFRARVSPFGITWLRAEERELPWLEAPRVLSEAASGEPVGA